MRTIAAREIKRCGIGVVDEALRDGPVYVIKSDQPRYVIMDQAHYQELLEAQEEANRARIAAALDDVKAGRTRRVTAKRLIDQFRLED